MQIKCLCGFETGEPDAMVMHIAETGHGMSEEIQKSLQDGGPFARELRDALITIIDPEKRAVAMAEGMIRPVDVDDVDDEE